MKDFRGKELSVGDWVKVQPPIFSKDLTGHLFTEKAEVGKLFEAPSHLGTVVARVSDVVVYDDKGAAISGKVRVTWLSSAGGSQRAEVVAPGECELVLHADGSEV